MRVCIVHGVPREECPPGCLAPRTEIDAPKTHLEETVEAMGFLLVWLVGYLGIPEDKVRAGVKIVAEGEQLRENQLVKDLAREVGAILDPIVESDGVSIVRATEFCCPKCGGSNYHTSGQGMTTGYCKGTGDEDRNYSCSFSWPRSEDWRVFVLTTSRRFTSREDYERVRKDLHHGS